MASADPHAERGPGPLDIDDVHMLLQVEQEQIQKRTFTNWINAQLAKRRPPVAVLDLFGEFADGSRLLDLLEVMSGQRMSREKGRGMFQHRTNIENALAFLKRKSIKLVNINVSDLMDGKPSIILGLIWTIIMHFHIEELASTLSFSSRQSSLESLASLDTRSTTSSTRSSPVPPRASPLHTRFRISAKKALLLWVREQCQRAGCILNVKDFKVSWRSGVVFLVILHALRPNIVDLARAQTRTNRQNLEEAFRVAERELHIPRLLDPADVDVRDPDEKSIMTYVAQFLQYSKDSSFPDEDMQCLSPVNLPSDFTPSIAASPLRQTSANQKAQEVTSWLVQAYQELIEGWDSTEGESYAERYQVFHTFIVSFNEQRRHVMPLLTAMKRTTQLSVEQKALRRAWDSLAEKLREYKTELDLGLPPPLDTVGGWLLRVEEVLSTEEGNPTDHAQAAQDARDKLELLKVCLEDTTHQIKRFQKFQNTNEFGETLVPTDKMEEMKRRFTSVRVTAKYHGIKLEYHECRHTVLDLINQLNVKLSSWKRAYISQESVRVLMQEWNETVNKQELTSLLDAALRRFKLMANKYTSKAALAGDSIQVSQQVADLEGKVAAIMEGVRMVKGTMGRVLSAWDTYSDIYSSLQAWLDQGPHGQRHGQRTEVTSSVMSEWGSRQAHLNEVSSFLIEVTDPQTSRAISDELCKINLLWADFVKTSQSSLAEDSAAGPPSAQTIQALMREANQLLKEPVEVVSGSLRVYTKRLQILTNRIKDVDLEALSPSLDCSAETLSKFQQAIPEVLQTLFEAEQVCDELRLSVSGLDRRLAELHHWEIEARDLYRELKDETLKQKRIKDPRARLLISRGLQLEGQVVMEEQDLQVMIMMGQKNSPLQYLIASTMQNKARNAVEKSQEAVGMLSSLGACRERSPPKDQPPAKLIVQTHEAEDVIQTQKSQGVSSFQNVPSTGSQKENQLVVRPKMSVHSVRDPSQAVDFKNQPLSQPLPEIVIQDCNAVKITYDQDKDSNFCEIKLQEEKIDILEQQAECQSQTSQCSEKQLKAEILVHNQQQSATQLQVTTEQQKSMTSYGQQQKAQTQPSNKQKRKSKKSQANMQNRPWLQHGSALENVTQKPVQNQPQSELENKSQTSSPESVLQDEKKVGLDTKLKSIVPCDQVNKELLVPQVTPFAEVQMQQHSTPVSQLKQNKPVLPPKPILPAMTVQQQQSTLAGSATQHQSTISVQQPKFPLQVVTSQQSQQTQYQHISPIQPQIVQSHHSVPQPVTLPVTQWAPQDLSKPVQQFPTMSVPSQMLQQQQPSQIDFQNQSWQHMCPINPPQQSPFPIQPRIISMPSPQMPFQDQLRGPTPTRTQEEHDWRRNLTQAHPRSQRPIDSANMDLPAHFQCLANPQSTNLAQSQQLSQVRSEVRTHTSLGTADQLQTEFYQKTQSQPLGTSTRPKTLQHHHGQLGPQEPALQMLPRSLSQAYPKNETHEPHSQSQHHNLRQQHIEPQWDQGQSKLISPVSQTALQSSHPGVHSSTEKPKEPQQSPQQFGLSSAESTTEMFPPSYVSNTNLQDLVKPKDSCKPLQVSQQQSSRVKQPSLAQAPPQAYTEAYSKAQALVRNRFEEAKHCLQEHILEAISLFKNKQMKDEQASVKEETLRTLDPDLLEEFLRTAEGMEAFCTPSELRDMEFFTQSVRTQWEACFLTKGSLAEASQQLEALKELCDTLSPEDAHRLAQAQLKECERRLAAIQHQFSGDIDSPSDLSSQAEQTIKTSVPETPPVSPVVEKTKENFPETSTPVVPQKPRTVEKREIVKQTSTEEDRYRSSRFALQTQLNRNEQCMVGHRPSESVTPTDLWKRLRELKSLWDETESLWKDYEAACAQYAHLHERAVDQDRMELTARWREQKSQLQGRVDSLGAALELMDSIELKISGISETLDNFIKEAKDIKGYALTNPAILKEAKDLDESIQTEMDRLSRFDSEPSHLDLRDRSPLTQVVLNHRSSLDRLRQQVRKSDAAARALDRFLMSLRTVELDVSSVQSAPISDVVVLQDSRSKLAMIRKGVSSLKDKAPQLDQLLGGAQLNVTQEEKPVSCLDMVCFLIYRVEEADDQLMIRQNELQKEQQSQGLSMRKKNIIAELQKVQREADKQGLKDPTLPAVQHRMRALSDLESDLNSLNPEYQSIKSQSNQDPAEEELDVLWEETERAVLDKLEQCTVLMDLLKKFQSCRSYLSSTLQRTEQTISEQASYMGKDNLQRLLTKVVGLKEELGGLGPKMEEFRTICKQLQCQLKKIPDCAETPFEMEAEALVDSWLDVSEKTDSYMDNLRVGLELWEKQLILGGEVDNWTSTKLVIFSESHPFTSENEVLSMKSEIQCQEDHLERFHRKMLEIKEMLQSKEPPLELQVVETNLRKKIEQVKELFSDCTDVFQELLAVKAHMTKKIDSTQSSVENIRSSIEKFSSEDCTQLNSHLQDLSEQLLDQEEQAESLLKEISLMSTVTGLEALEELTNRHKRLKESITDTREQIHIKKEQGEKSFLQTIKEEWQSFEEWLQDEQLSVNECFENPETKEDLDASLQKLTNFLTSKDGVQRLSLLKERFERECPEKVPAEAQALFSTWHQEQEGELATLRAHCQGRHKQLDDILHDLKNLQEEHNYLKEWLKGRDQVSGTRGKLRQAQEEFLSESGRMEAIRDLLSTVRVRGLRGEPLLRDIENMLEQYQNLGLHLESQAERHNDLDDQTEKFHMSAEHVKAWIRDLKQGLESISQETVIQEKCRRAQAVLDVKSEGTAKLMSLKERGDALGAHEFLEATIRQELIQISNSLEDEWKRVQTMANQLKAQAELQDTLMKEMEALHVQEENTQSWIREKLQTLTSLGKELQPQEKLIITQDMLNLRHEASSKLSNLKTQGEHLCLYKEITSDKRSRIDQTQKMIEQEWKKVLQLAQDLENQAKDELNFYNDLENSNDQVESICVWIRQLRDKLDSLVTTTSIQERLTGVEAIFTCRHEGDSKLAELQDKVEKLSSYKDLEQEKHHTVQQILQNAQQEWKDVLKDAQKLKDKWELEDSLCKDFQDLQKHLESTDSWIKEQQSKLKSLVGAQLQERMQGAQAILNSESEGNCQFSYLISNAVKLCSREELLEPKKQEFQPKLRYIENEWKKVLKIAQEIKAQAELQTTLERDLQDAHYIKDSTSSWVKKQKVLLDSLGKNTHGSQNQIEERMNKAQEILSFSSEANAKITTLQKTLDKLIVGEDLKESTRHLLVDEVNCLEREWKTILHEAEELHSLLKGTMERLVSFRCQKEQIQSRLEQVKQQTAALPRSFPWPGLGDRRHTLEQARSLLDRTRALTPSLSDLRALGKEMSQLTEDSSWIDPSWATMEECIPELIRELSELCDNVEEGIQKERVCAQLVEQHTLAQDWLREQVKGFGPLPSERLGLQGFINTLKALVKTVEREKSELKELNEVKDSLMKHCSSGGRDALTLNISHLHDLCMSSKKEIEELLAICEAICAEIDQKLADRATSLRTQAECLLGELRALDQFLGDVDSTENISQLQENWLKFKSCDHDLEVLEGKVRDLGQAIQKIPPEEELPSCVISFVDAVTQQYCSLRSKMSERQNDCADCTVQCVRQTLQNIQSWNQKNVDIPCSIASIQTASEEGARLHDGLLEALSHKELLKDCLGSEFAEKLERDGWKTLQEQETHMNTLKQELDKLEEKQEALQMSQQEPESEVSAVLTSVCEQFKMDSSLPDTCVSYKNEHTKAFLHQDSDNEVSSLVKESDIAIHPEQIQPELLFECEDITQVTPNDAADQNNQFTSYLPEGKEEELEPKKIAALILDIDSVRIQNLDTTTASSAGKMICGSLAKKHLNKTEEKQHDKASSADKEFSETSVVSIPIFEEPKENGNQVHATPLQLAETPAVASRDLGRFTEDNGPNAAHSERSNWTADNGSRDVQQQVMVLDLPENRDVPTQEDTSSSELAKALDKKSDYSETAVDTVTNKVNVKTLDPLEEHIEDEIPLLNAPIPSEDKTEVQSISSTKPKKKFEDSPFLWEKAPSYEDHEPILTDQVRRRIEDKMEGNFITPTPPTRRRKSDRLSLNLETETHLILPTPPRRRKDKIQTERFSLDLDIQPTPPARRRKEDRRLSLELEVQPTPPARRRKEKEDRLSLLQDSQPTPPARRRKDKESQRSFDVETQPTPPMRRPKNKQDNETQLKYPELTKGDDSEEQIVKPTPPVRRRVSHVECEVRSQEAEIPVKPTPPMRRKEGKEEKKLPTREYLEEERSLLEPTLDTDVVSASPVNQLPQPTGVDESPSISVETHVTQDPLILDQGLSEEKIISLCKNVDMKTEVHPEKHESKNDVPTPFKSENLSEDTQDSIKVDIVDKTGENQPQIEDTNVSCELGLSTQVTKHLQEEIPEGPTMKDIFTEIRQVIEKGPKTVLVEGMPHESIQKILDTSNTDLEAQLKRLVFNLFDLRNCPAALNSTDMVKQLHQAEEYRCCAQEQVSILCHQDQSNGVVGITSNGKTHESDVMHQLSSQWSAVLWDAASSVHSKEAQLQMVVDFEKQILKVQHILSVLKSDYEAIQTSPADSCLVEKEKLCTFLRNMEQERTAIGDLIQIYAKISSHLSIPDKQAAEIQQNNIQSQWRALEKDAEMALYRVNAYSNESTGLCQETLALKEDLKSIQKTLDCLKSSSCSWDSQKAQDVMTINANLTYSLQQYLIIKQASETLDKTIQFKIEASRLEQDLQNVKKQMDLFGEQLVAVTITSTNPMLTKIVKILTDGLAWAKQTECAIKRRQIKVPLFPEEVHRQIKDFKKLQLDMNSKQNQLKTLVEEVSGVKLNLDENDVNMINSSLKTLADLSKLTAEKLDYTIHEMESGLQTREKMSEQIADVDSWVVGHLQREAQRREDYQSLSLKDLDHRLKQIQTTLAEADKQSGIIEALLMKGKDIASELSVSDNIYLNEKLVSLQDNIKSIIRYERASHQKVLEIIQSQESSQWKVSSLEKSLSQMLMDVKRHEFPVTKDTLSAIEPFKQMIVERKSQVEQVSPCSDHKRRELLCIITELHHLIIDLEVKARAHEHYLSRTQCVMDLKEELESQIPRTKDESISQEERFGACQSLLTQIPLTQLFCEETREELLDIATDLHPSQLTAEQERFNQILDNLKTLELTLHNNRQILELDLLKHIHLPSEHLVFQKFLEDANAELVKPCLMEPKEVVIEKELRKCLVLRKDIEFRMHVIDVLVRKTDQCDPKQTLASSGEAIQENCDKRMVILTDAKLQLRNYTKAIVRAILFLQRASLVLLPSICSARSCSERLKDTQNALTTLDSDFQSHLSEVQTQSPLNTCFNPQTVEYLQTEIIGNLLIRLSTLKAQAQLNLESLKRCVETQKHSRKCYEELCQQVRDSETLLSQCASNKITSHKECTEQEQKLTALVKRIDSLPGKLEDLREWCSLYGCRANREDAVSALWWQVERLQRCSYDLLARSDQLKLEWTAVTKSVKQAARVLKQVTAELPEMSKMNGSADELHEMLLFWSQYQDRLDCEHRALSALELRVARLLGVPPHLEQAPAIALFKEIQTLQEQYHSLKDQSSQCERTVRSEVEEREKLREQLQEVKEWLDSTTSLLSVLENESNQKQLQDVHSQLCTQKAILQRTSESLKTMYSDRNMIVPEKIEELMKAVSHSFQEVEEQVKTAVEKSGPLHRLGAKISEIKAGLGLVQSWLEQKSLNCPEAEVTQKRVWDELNGLHTRLTAVEVELQDISDVHPDEMCLISESLTNTKQICTRLTTQAEQRTSFLNKIRDWLQEHEEMVMGSQSWILEAQSWLTTPCTYTTARCLDSHVNALQLVLDDSAQMRRTLQSFGRVLTEMGNVLDVSNLEEQLSNADRRVADMQHSLLGPLSQLEHAAAEVDAIESEVKVMESDVAKIKSTLMAEEGISQEELKITEDRIDLMKRTVAEIQNGKDGLSLPENADNVLVVFKKAEDIRKQLLELDQLALEYSIKAQEIPTTPVGLLAHPVTALSVPPTIAEEDIQETGQIRVVHVEDDVLKKSGAALMTVEQSTPQQRLSWISERSNQNTTETLDSKEEEEEDELYLDAEEFAYGEISENINTFDNMDEEDRSSQNSDTFYVLALEEMTTEDPNASTEQISPTNLKVEADIPIAAGAGVSEALSSTDAKEESQSLYEDMEQGAWKDEKTKAHTNSQTEVMLDSHTVSEALVDPEMPRRRVSSDETTLYQHQDLVSKKMPSDETSKHPFETPIQQNTEEERLDCPDNPTPVIFKAHMKTTEEPLVSTDNDLPPFSQTTQSAASS